MTYEQEKEKLLRDLRDAEITAYELEKLSEFLSEACCSFQLNKFGWFGILSALSTLVIDDLRAQEELAKRLRLEGEKRGIAVECARWI